MQSMKKNYRNGVCRIVENQADGGWSDIVWFVCRITQSTRTQSINPVINNITYN